MASDILFSPYQPEWLDYLKTKSERKMFGWNFLENNLNINLPSKLFGIFGLVASASGILYLLNTGLSQNMYIIRKGFGLTKYSATV